MEEDWWRYSSTHSSRRHLLEISGQLQFPATSHPGKEPRRPLKRRLVGPRRRCGRFGELKKNLFSLPELESHTVQPVAQSEY